MLWIQETPSGEMFDTSGPLRVETRKEEFFVVGLGKLEAVESIHEGNQLIRDLRNEMLNKETEDDRTVRYSHDSGNPVDLPMRIDRV